MKTNGSILVCFFISSCLTFGACVPSQKAVKGTLPSSSIFETGISEKEIPDEIERLKKLTEDKTGKAVSSNTYLQLAVLYSSYRNEDPDYVSALAAIEKYMTYYSGGLNEAQVNTLHSLLKSIEQLSSSKRKNNNDKKLRARNRLLIKRNEELTKNNEALKETIKKLGRIDLNLEHKKKTYK